MLDNFAERLGRLPWGEKIREEWTRLTAKRIGAAGSVFALRRPVFGGSLAYPRQGRQGSRILGLRLKRGFQLEIRIGEIFRNHARFPDGGHEVRIARPARQHMHVDVPRDARARALT